MFVSSSSTSLPNSNHVVNSLIYQVNSIARDYRNDFTSLFKALSDPFSTIEQVNPEIIQHFTLLHEAAKRGYFILFKTLLTALIERGASIGQLNPADSDGNTPFHFAALNGNSLIVSKYLIVISDRGGAISELNPPNHFGRTPLHQALDNESDTALETPKIVRDILNNLLMFVPAPDQINPPDIYGTTPLMQAGESGKTQIVQIIRDAIRAQERIAVEFHNLSLS